MGTIFINSRNSKTDPHSLLLILSIYYTWQNIKSHRKTINLKY